MAADRSATTAKDGRAATHRACFVIQQILPEPQASLLSGILLGIDSGLPASVQEDFHATGTSHIIAISGWIPTTMRLACQRRPLLITEHHYPKLHHIPILALPVLSTASVMLIEPLSVWCGTLFQNSSISRTDASCPL